MRNYYVLELKLVNAADVIDLLVSKMEMLYNKSNKSIQETSNIKLNKHYTYSVNIEKLEQEIANFESDTEKNLTVFEFNSMIDLYKKVYLAYNFNQLYLRYVNFMILKRIKVNSICILRS